MADVKWIKITTDVFDDEKILLIESLPEKDSLIVIWFKLLCLAGKQNNSGVFMISNRMPYTDEMLATIFRRPINTVRLALATFQQYGMIDIIDDVITIPNWNKHQSLDAYEKKKARDRLYQAERRAAQKALIGQSSDESSDIVVSDKEEDKEEDKNKKKKSKKEEALALLNRLLPDYGLPEVLEEKMVDWVTYKAERKDFYTEQGMKALLRQVENNHLTYGKGSVLNLIDESMCNNYKGIIFDRLKSKAKDTPKQQQQDEEPDFLKKWSV